VEYLEEGRFGVGWIKELSKRGIAERALRTEDCERARVYELGAVGQLE